jgi:hypothetical protein
MQVSMSYKNDHEINTLIRQFEGKTLPKSDWTHHAHLTVGLYYSYYNPMHESLCIMKSKIITYNEAVGTINTPSSGYHETLTLFWLKIIDNFLQDRSQLPLHELCNIFLSSPQANKELPLRHYSKERLFSVQARATWIEPDVRPI